MKSLFRCAGRRGAVAIQVAVALVALVAFLSLGTEFVRVLMTSRHMQSAADAAALAAVQAETVGYPADFRIEAEGTAAGMGFANGVDGSAITVNRPPVSGSHITDSTAIEVVITQPQNLPLASVVYRGGLIARARAVAVSGSASCLLVLDPSDGSSLSMNGNTVANFAGCDVSVNSSATQAISLVGGATINAHHVYIAGGYSATGGSAINASDGITTYTSAVADPYAGYTMPTPAGSCSPKYESISGNTTIPPGTYCYIVVKKNTTTLSPGGNYIITQSPGLQVSNGATLNGSGVTIVLTTDNTSGYAGVTVQAGATLNLSAPAAGSTQGVPGLIFFQDRNAPHCTNCNSLQGGAAMQLTGALYFPSQSLSFGGGTTATTQCTQIVAWQLNLIGNAALNASCSGTGVQPIRGGGSLVE